MKFGLVLFSLLAVALPLAAFSQGPLQDAPPGQVVACDLIDEQTVTTLLASPISQKSPNRQIQKFDGASISACLFVAGRNILRVELFEYPSEELAKQKYKAEIASGDGFISESERGLGNEGAWWHLRTEKYGFTVRKGKRIYFLSTSWASANDGKGLKERMKPIAAAALAKL